MGWEFHGVSDWEHAPAGVLTGRRRGWRGPAYGTGVWLSDYVTLPVLGLYEPMWRYDIRPSPGTGPITPSTGRSPDCPAGSWPALTGPGSLEPDGGDELIDRGGALHTVGRQVEPAGEATSRQSGERVDTVDQQSR